MHIFFIAILVFNERTFGTSVGEVQRMPPDKCAYLKIILFISQLNHMLLVLKRTVSMRRFF